MEGRQKRSEVWNHFRVHGEDESLAVCIHCSKTVSRGRNRRTYNTTNMNRHLQNCALRHRPQGAQVSDSSSSSSSQPSHPVQASMTSFVANKTAYGKGHPRQLLITRKIGIMMAVDMRPFTLVENEGFRDLMNTVDPRYTIPSRSVFARNVIPNVFEEVKRNLKADIERTVGGLCFTTDMWRSGQHKEFMCVTLHWIIYDERKHVSQSNLYYLSKHIYSCLQVSIIVFPAFI